MKSPDTLTQGQGIPVELTQRMVRTLSENTDSKQAWPGNEESTRWRYAIKKHRHFPEYDALPEAQGGTGRHKCAACAYEKGMADALAGNPEATDDSVLQELPESQAGSMRHKDAFMAYQCGYKQGLKDMNSPVIR